MSFVVACNTRLIAKSHQCTYTLNIRKQYQKSTQVSLCTEHSMAYDVHTISVGQQPRIKKKKNMHSVPPDKTYSVIVVPDPQHLIQADFAVMYSTR